MDGGNKGCSLSQERKPLIRGGFDLYSPPRQGPAASWEPGCAGAMPGTAATCLEQTSARSPPRVYPPLVGSSARASALNAPVVPWGPEPRLADPVCSGHCIQHGPRRGKACVGVTAMTQGHVTVDSSTRAEGSRGRNMARTALPTNASADRATGTSMDTRPCAGHHRQEGPGRAAGHGDKPGRRLQRGPAAAGMTCVCPATELPPPLLMAKACGRTSGSGGETPRASSGPLDSCTASCPASPSAAASPAARRARAAAGRGQLRWAETPAELWAGVSRSGSCRGGRTCRGVGWRHTQRRGCSPRARAFTRH